jgi:uncharacterized membrane protein YkoI
MKLRTPLLSATALLGLLLAFALPPAGADDDDQVRARELSRSGRILPLERIAERAQAVHPGRLLEIDLEERHGRTIYEVELLDAQGRTWEIELDARTGEVLRSKEDD